jgi:hypothetical protein
MNNADIITFWGRFNSSETEEKFRTGNLLEDLRTARFLSLIATVIVVLFLLIDWKFKAATPVFRVLLRTRFVILASTAALLYRLRRAITPEWLDRWLLGWISITILMASYSLSTRTPAEAAPMSILIILIVSVLIPMRFSLQAGTATLSSLVFMSVIVSKKPPIPLLFAGLTALTVTLVVGLISSSRLHRTRREAFAAHQVERETVAKLEAALAEVKTLEGILPICASCKKIRREEGGWMAVEEYITERSKARFSHGMCPTCMASLYPSHARSQKA